MSALIAYTTVNQESAYKSENQALDWTETDLSLGYKWFWDETQKYIVVPFIRSFDDVIYTGYGHGFGINAIVKITTDQGIEEIKLASHEDAEKLVEVIKAEIEDFYGNYESYVKTLG